MRNDSIPEDPQKIGQLRETYEWFLKMWEATRMKRRLDNIADKAFARAGEERKHFMRHGKWMSHGEAKKKFLEVVIRG